jgi:hypothetical protein
LFDVCSVVCDTPPKAEESVLVRALAYFEGVLGSGIADTKHISYLQACAARSVTLCMHGSGFVPYPII